jgi:HK97 family phage prohead protease
MARPMPPSVVRKLLSDTTVTPDARAGTVRFVASTSAMDRQGDTVNSSGWDLDAYRRNPVVQFSHQYDALPVGRAASVDVRAGQLLADIEFTPEHLNPFGARVGEMVRGGWLSGISVGFQPIEHAYNETHKGFDFKRQALLELSIVPVPALAEALVVRGLGGAAAGRRAVDAWVCAGRGAARVLDGIICTEHVLEEKRIATNLVDLEAWMNAPVLLEHDLTRRIGRILELSRTRAADGVAALAARVELDGPDAAAIMARVQRGELTGFSVKTTGSEAMRIGPGGRREIRGAVLDELSLCRHPKDVWARLRAVA